MSIKLKIISLTVLSSLLLLGAFLVNIYYQEGSVTTEVDQELDTIMLNNTKNVVQNVSSQLKALNDVLISDVVSGLNVSDYLLNKNGSPKLSATETVQWNAVNQYTKNMTKIRVPKMVVGGNWLGKNRSLSVPSPVVDEAKRLVGGTTTIFQRINEQGDMLRVCTNVEKLDSTRAVGTYIPAINPDGTKNPVISTLNSGQTFYGRAYVVNAWYLTAYKPFYNSKKEIIGAIYYGIMQEKTEALRRGIKNTVLGKSGHIYVIDRNGRYIISKGGQQDGKNAWNTTDSDGKKYIQSIIKKALILKSGDVDYERYHVQEQLDTGADLMESPHGETKAKVVAITYFEPWDWIVVADAYEEDFKETKFKMQSSVQKMATWGMMTGGVVMILIILIAFIVSEKITNPIKQLTEAAEDISSGNLNRGINITGKDEIGHLATAFKRMQSSLAIVMQQVVKN